MLWPNQKIWEWELIFGHAVKAISSLGIRSPWVQHSNFFTNNGSRQYYKHVTLALFTLKQSER